eukprot:gene21277-28198_t
MSRRSRDPRSQAHDALAYKEQYNALSTAKTFEQLQLSQTKRTVNSAADVVTSSETLRAQNSLAKQEAAKGRPQFSGQGTHYEDKVHPPFLDKSGLWVQDAIPSLIAPSHTQNLTTTGRMDGSKGAVQLPRPVAAVHTYNDVSPVLTSEHTRDVGRTEVEWDNTINKRGLMGKPDSAPPPPTMMETVITTKLTPSHMLDKTKDMGNASVRKSNVESFWNRQTGGTHLELKDCKRIGDELSTHAVAGSANARLVGGKWRYMERPVDGAVLFTEYYGPVAGGPQTSDYYGRTYHYLPQ